MAEQLEQERDVTPANEPAIVTLALEVQGICLYCDEPLDGETINGLHLDCDRELNQEMELVYGPILEIIE